MRTDLRPTIETIDYYYPRDYGPYLGTRVDLGRNDQYRSMPRWKHLIKPLFETYSRHVPTLPPGRMLEIGCASGSFMYKMAQRGWSVEGIEPDAEAAGATRSLGFPVYTGNLEHAPNPAEPYDLVVGWMVLEHLHEPVLALRKLHRWSRPGAWIALSIPNAGSLEFRLFRDQWYALDVPRHLYHYRVETVSQVLEAGGWKLEKVFHQRVLTNLFASLGYVLRSRGIDNRLVKGLIRYGDLPYRLQQLFHPLAFLLSLLGQTGRMTVWATRVND
jgi:2-polyprenyl-3-methyl-5-hydroxy-6-metoxy-1,4-benzoquinol methylase